MPEPTSSIVNVIPSDGSPLVLSLPKGTHQLVLEGAFRSESFDITIDGLDADSEGALLQIEPGQWYVATSHPEQHQFTLISDQTIPNQVQVQLDFDHLTQQFLVSPERLHQSLHGQISVRAEAPPPPPPPIEESGSLLSVAGLLGLILALVLVVGGAARSVAARRARDADLRRALGRVRILADELCTNAVGQARLTSEGAEVVVRLRKRAEEAVADAKRVRQGLHAPGSEELRVASTARAPKTEAEARERGRSLKTWLGVQTAMVERERWLTAALEQIRAQLEGIRDLCAGVESTAPAVTEAQVRSLMASASTITETSHEDGEDSGGAENFMSMFATGEFPLIKSTGLKGANGAMGTEGAVRVEGAAAVVGAEAVDAAIGAEAVDAAVGADRTDVQWADRTSAPNGTTHSLPEGPGHSAPHLSPEADGPPAAPSDEPRPAGSSPSLKPTPRKGPGC